MQCGIDESLIIGYINDTITQAERKIVEQWIMLTPQNRQYFTELDSAHDAMKVDKEVYDAIDVERGYRRCMKLESSKRSLNYKDVLVMWQKVAAVLILPLTLAFISYIVFNEDDSMEYLSQSENMAWQEIVSPNGTRVNVDLPDGTKVVLNANSKLRFPLKFTAGQRDVELSGEAYFDVVSDKENPFKVKCAKETIIATGTAFNVEAYEWDTVSMVILERGVIDVAYNNSNRSIRLKPNERLTSNYINGRIEKAQVNAAQMTAWRDGKLIFRDENLSEVMRKIGIIYNLDIVFQDKEIMNHGYHATFEDESLHEILRLMKISMPITFVDIDRKQQSTGDYKRRKIIIKNR